MFLFTDANADFTTPDRQYCVASPFPDIIGSDGESLLVSAHRFGSSLPFGDGSDISGNNRDVAVVGSPTYDTFGVSCDYQNGFVVPLSPQNLADKSTDGGLTFIVVAQITAAGSVGVLMGVSSDSDEQGRMWMGYESTKMVAGYGTTSAGYTSTIANDSTRETGVRLYGMTSGLTAMNVYRRYSGVLMQKSSAATVPAGTANTAKGQIAIGCNYKSSGYVAVHDIYYAAAYRDELTQAQIEEIYQAVYADAGEIGLLDWLVTQGSSF